MGDEISHFAEQRNVVDVVDGVKGMDVVKKIGGQPAALEYNIENTVEREDMQLFFYRIRRQAVQHTGFIAYRQIIEKGREPLGGVLRYKIMQTGFRAALLQIVKLAEQFHEAGLVFILQLPDAPCHKIKGRRRAVGVGEIKVVRKGCLRVIHINDSHALGLIVDFAANLLVPVVVGGENGGLRLLCVNQYIVVIAELIEPGYIIQKGHPLTAVLGDGLGRRLVNLL